MKNITKFEAGKTYSMRSICDNDCVWNITIISRTAKTVKAKVQGTIKNFRVEIYEGVEQFFPTGRYSMAPRLTADKDVK